MFRTRPLLVMVLAALAGCAGEPATGDPLLRAMPLALLSSHAGPLVVEVDALDVDGTIDGRPISFHDGDFEYLGGHWFDGVAWVSGESHPPDEPFALSGPWVSLRVCPLDSEGHPLPVGNCGQEVLSVTEAGGADAEVFYRTGDRTGLHDHVEATSVDLDEIRRHLSLDATRDGAAVHVEMTYWMRTPAPGEPGGG